MTTCRFPLSPPVPVDECDQVKNAFSELEAGEGADLASLARSNDEVFRLLGGIFSASPFLTGLILRDPDFASRFFQEDASQMFRAIVEGCLRVPFEAEDVTEVRQHLRQAKARVALLLALQDLGGKWPVMEVTAALTEFADAAVQASVQWLMLDASRKNKMTLTNVERPELGCGYTVLAMGKHGAGELNYSSDIDLIVLYDPETAPLSEGTEPSSFFVRLTRQLVSMLQEITEDGYVFRTDLRLRPDPRATQVAIAMEAAAIYYENMGQNWERAAMIKARAIAGDIALGEEFLDRLRPYVWRKYLDFAAIADVQSMKRQIHAVKGHGTIAVAGHNIKLGRGGIREIEFFVQTQQLIAGGRNPDLRGRKTIDMLNALARAEWITPETASELSEAYFYLRCLEHRIQMIADEQTQELSSSTELLTIFARFCGFDKLEDFEASVLSVLSLVQSHYAALFEDTDELALESGNLVFTGADDDPGTIETLSRLGFIQPHEVSAVIRGWHFGRYGSTRTAQARERLTELMPALLKSLADTGDGDAALFAFDRFIAGLPAGIQLFSMLRANPHLLDLVATILGTAPRLAEQVSQRSRVMDAVLDPGFFEQLPDPDEIIETIANEVPAGGVLEDALDRARVVGKELAFRIGVRLISETLSPIEAGHSFSALADGLILRLLDAVLEDVAERHGVIPGAEVSVIAMGKLGGREMTAASDLDLILVYDHDTDATASDGAKPLMAAQYFARVTQRLIAALSAPTAEGVLYEVDMRLRPSGNKGPVASHVDAFLQYHENSAWTWERLALTRARVINPATRLGDRLCATINDFVKRPVEAERARKDIVEMRQLMLAEHGGGAPWNIKGVRGGLVEIEFIAQTLQLLHAGSHPQIISTSTNEALEASAAAGLLSPADKSLLLEASLAYHRLTQILRLCVTGQFDPAGAPDGLKRLVANAAHQPDIAQAQAALEELQGQVADCFDRLVGTVNESSDDA